MTFRQLLFWMHLAAGLIAGIAIAIMCFTGTVLAFEKELVAWSERDARRVEAPSAGTPRLPLDELREKLRAAQPEARPMSIVIQNDPHAAVAFTTGRTGGFYVNPYTGEVRQPESAAMGRFMHVMVEWHRYLGFHGDVSRPRGKLVNGVCNVAFLVLALTGLYLWMPRSWSWRALRPIVWFRQNSSSRARDFNWHNSIGFWTAPILIVLTVTAMPISFRWAGDLIYVLTGTPAPATSSGGQAPGVSTATNAEIPAPPAGARPVSMNTVFTSAAKEMPEWKTMTIRLVNAAAPGGRSSAPRPEGTTNISASRTTLQPVTVTIREKATWPRTATTTLALNPYSGDVLRRTGYTDMNAVQKVRAWTRFLHTGEAVGKGGQFVAGLACLGGLFLVYTGFALSWRRFFGRPGRNTNALPAEPTINEREATVVDRTN